MRACGACAPLPPAGEVKKRYWRLSLLIHPDKCSHPQAHDAFQAVTAAAKELQVGVCVCVCVCAGGLTAAAKAWLALLR